MLKKDVLLRILDKLKDDENALNLLLELPQFKSLLVHNGFVYDIVNQTYNIPNHSSLITFKEFRAKLYSTGCFNRNGHVENKQEYLVITDGAQEAFNSIKSSIKDIDTAIEACLNYYKDSSSTRYGFVKFCMEDVFIAEYAMIANKKNVLKPKKNQFFT